MTNPNTSGIPGMGAMTDTFDFMKNLWGGMSMPGMSGMKIPGMVMPTLSVEEIDKQIKDLKSVESWLTINLNMLRGTIQALEVQSATITTIQSMSSSFASAMQPTTKPESNSDAKIKPQKPGKPIFESPFVAPAAKPQAPQADASKSSAPPTSAEAAATDAPSGDAATLVPPMANPAAWWGMLQDQFKQAVDTAAAMTPEMPVTAASKTEQADEKPAKAEKAARAEKPAPTKAPAKRKPGSSA